MVKVVLPGTANHFGTLFGGTLLSWMDEMAYITATRFSRCRMVTVSSDQIDFKQPIPTGTIVELVGKVERVGNTSVRVQVDVYLEKMFSDDRTKAVTGGFTMVAVDEDNRPLPLPK